MQVAGIGKNNSSFGNGFYNVTRELDSSVMLSRALIDTFGCTIPWIVMANNDTEKKEKTRRYLLDYAIIWLTPFVTLLYILLLLAPAASPESTSQSKY